MNAAARALPLALQLAQLLAHASGIPSTSLCQTQDISEETCQELQMPLQPCPKSGRSVCSSVEPALNELLDLVHPASEADSWQAAQLAGRILWAASSSAARQQVLSYLFGSSTHNTVSSYALRNVDLVGSFQRPGGKLRLRNSTNEKQSDTLGGVD